MKIAVTGKGGVGKTTFAATLARLYAAEGRPYHIYPEYHLLSDSDDRTDFLLSHLYVPPQAYAVETDIEKLVDLMIERIEEKRTALGI